MQHQHHRNMCLARVSHLNIRHLVSFGKRASGNGSAEKNIVRNKCSVQNSIIWNRLLLPFSVLFDRALSFCQKWYGHLPALVIRKCKYTREAHHLWVTLSQFWPKAAVGSVCGDFQTLTAQLDCHGSQCQGEVSSQFHSLELKDETFECRNWFSLGAPGRKLKLKWLAHAYLRACWSDAVWSRGRLRASPISRLIKSCSLIWSTALWCDGKRVLEIFVKEKTLSYLNGYD